MNEHIHPVAATWASHRVTFSHIFIGSLAPDSNRMVEDQLRMADTELVG
jgi:hypothetical protein